MHNSNLCDFCHKQADTTGAILDGNFGQACRQCRSTLDRASGSHSAQYQRDRDREAHQRDLIQPWDKNGDPNTEFIRQYPEESQDYFTDDQRKNYG